MKYIIRKLITASLFICCLSGDMVNAQTPQQVLASIYGKYDSLANLTFDIKYTYSSDTLYGDFMYDVLEGTYTMNGRKAKFRLGDIEYLQNDSFFIAVYKQDELMMVTEPRQTNSGSFLPLRDQLDSLVIAYAAHYTITPVVNDSIGQLVFDAADTIAQYKRFIIEYEADSKLLRALTYWFTEVVPMENSVTDVSRVKNLKIEFLRHRFDQFSDALYDENQYVVTEEGVLKPAVKYAGFRLFNSKAVVPQ